MSAHVLSESLNNARAPAWALSQVLRKGESLTKYEESMKILLDDYMTSYKVFQLMLLSPPLTWLTGVFNMFQSLENFELKINLLNVLKLIYRIFENLITAKGRPE